MGKGQLAYNFNELDIYLKHIFKVLRGVKLNVGIKLPPYFEIEHFNTLLREGKTESSMMTFNFSKDLIKILDKVRGIIGLRY